MHQDPRGLELSTHCATAAEAFNQTLNEFLDYELSATTTLKTVAAEDSEFALGHVMRVYLLSMLETVAIRPKLAQSVETARKLAGDATLREQMHVDAAACVVAGDALGAMTTWRNLLQQYPQDLLALKMHHYTTFWTGRSRELQAVALGVDHAWDEQMPGYGYVLGMQAFALEECGDLVRAEDHARRAIELNNDDLWALHALAHVLESDGRSNEGAELLDFDLDHFESKNPFAGHLWWHRALFEIELGKLDVALALYDDAVSAASTEFYLDVQNRTSLLKRLELAGIETGNRWQVLAEFATSHVEDHALAFTSIHNLLALAVNGDFVTADAMIKNMEAFASTPNNYAASTMHDATLPLCRAIVDYERGDLKAAASQLGALRHHIDAIGGSHAQRDLFNQILIDALDRDDQLHGARTLLTERLSLRPGSPSDWQRYAAVLHRLGEKDAATEALAIATEQSAT